MYTKVVRTVLNMKASASKLLLLRICAHMFAWWFTDETFWPVLTHFTTCTKPNFAKSLTDNIILYWLGSTNLQLCSRGYPAYVHMLIGWLTNKTWPEIQKICSQAVQWMWWNADIITSLKKYLARFAYLSINPTSISQTVDLITFVKIWNQNWPNIL